MSRRWIHMMHSLRSFLCRRRSRGTAKACALALALLTLLPASGLADAPRFRVGRPENPQVVAYLQEALDYIPEKGEKQRKKPLYVGDWVLRQEGFAFHVPEGMAVVPPVRGTNVVLRDMRQEESDLSLATISVTVIKEKERLDSITQERTRSAYASVFQEFSLTEFVRETICGAECVRISYMAGIAPRLYVRQYMFDKDDQRYTVTLTMESKWQNIGKGLGWLETFCESLMFRQAPEGAADQAS